MISLSFWQQFASMLFADLLHPKERRKGMLSMCKREKEYWQAFIRTGQIQDYLRYCLAGRDEPNPRRRIQDSSKYKHFW